jgi:hypothetical protein
MFQKVSKVMRIQLTRLSKHVCSLKFTTMTGLGDAPSKGEEIEKKKRRGN